MHSRLRILLSLVAVAALAATVAAPGAFAQGATTGALSGVVNDQSGARLPGVTVTAVHTPTGGIYTVTSSSEGRYNIGSMRVGGPYTLTAELDGFKAQVLTDIYVNLGRDATVDFSLELGAVEEVVTVVGDAESLFSGTRTGNSTNVSTETIENLPTLNRGLEDFAKTNPFVTITSQNEDPESITVAGRNNRYNNIQIDGSVNNDLFGLAGSGTPGGQAATTPISLDAIAQLQVVIADYDVRQGGFSGGSVNAITRNGTNAWKGSAFYYTRDDSLVGDGPDVLGELGTFEEDTYGFRLGGPISRDKVFFFVNGEIADENAPTGFSIDGSGGQAYAQGIPQAQAAATRFRNILINRYGFDPGGFGQNNKETPSDKYFGRVDFNVADNHQLTLRHNYVDATNDINRPDARFYEFPSETYFFSTETNSTVVQFNSVLGSDMFNELRVARQVIKDRRTPRDGVRFPWIEIENVFGFPSAPAGFNGFEFEAGSENFSTENALDQEIFELTDDFTLVRGNHNFVIGTHNEIFSFENLFVQNSFGSYEFNTLDDFEAGRAETFQYTNVLPGADRAQKFDVTQVGLYAGDRWQFRPNLTLTFGLRVDVPYFPDQPSRNPLTEQLYGFRTSEIPDGEQVWQPRLGFNWDLSGDARSQLRGGAGIFAGRTPYVWISNVYARTGIEQQFIRVTTPTGATPNIPFSPDPDNQPTSFPGATVGVGEFNLIDPDFKFPQVLRFNLAYDRELPWWGLVASVEGIYSDNLEDIDYKNVNLRITGTQPFDGRPIFSRVANNVDGAYLITNTSKGEAYNVALKLEKPYSGGLSGYATYVYGQANAVNDGTSSRAVSNWQFNEAINQNDADESVSDFEVEHRFTGSLSYQFNRNSRWATTVATYYNLQSGRPFAFLVGGTGNINGDTFNSNDLLYVPDSADDVVLTGGTFAQLESFIDRYPCLQRSRGGIAPRNCEKAPWNHSLDLHLAQDIPVPKSSLQLTFDLVNLMNLIDEDSGTLRYVPFNTVTVADFLGTTADGKPRYALRGEVTNPNFNVFTTHNLNSRWRAKIGLRWTF